MYRILFYVLGLLVLAFGVAFAVNSNLGVSPVNSFPFAVSVVSGIKFGTCVTAVYVCYVLVQVVLLRRDFKLKNLLQVVFATLFGYFVDFAKFVLGGFAIPTYFGQLAMLAISILLIALGLSFYLSADIVPMPSEGMALAIAQKAKRLPFHRVKIFVDCASVVLAILTSLIGTGSIQGVREGTVISALVIGKVMGMLMKHIKPRVEALCFAPEPAQQAGENG